MSITSWSRFSAGFAGLVLCQLAEPALVSSAPRWVQASPAGAYLTAFAQSPVAPGTLYVAGPPRALFVSVDGGATWRERVSGVDQTVELLADPREAETLYLLAASHKALRTADRGRTWTAMGDDLEFNALALEGASGAILAGTSSGLFRSSDRGAHWQLTAFADSNVIAIALDPRDGRRRLAAVGPTLTSDLQTLWASADGGEHWALAAPPSSDFEVRQTTAPRLVFDRAAVGVVYALYPQSNDISAHPISRSEDFAQTWSDLPDSAYLADLVSALDGTLYSANYDGVRRSLDRGATWLPAQSFPSRATPRDRLARVAIGLDVDGGAAVVYAVGGAGLWQSIPGTPRWRSLNGDLVRLPAIDLDIAPTGPAVVTALAGNGVFRSADRGATWTRINRDVQTDWPFEISAIDPRRPETLFGLAFDGLQSTLPVRSVDGGRSWLEIDSFPYGCGGDSACAVDIRSLIMDPLHPGTLYASGNYFIHLSGMGDYVLRSENNGQTWKARTAIHGITALAASALRSGTLFGLTGSRLYKSADGAKSWARKGEGLPHEGLLSLALDTRSPDLIYVGTRDRGVYASRDGGETFGILGAGLPPGAVSEFAIDPTDSSTVYAAVPRHGVFSWNAARHRWEPLNDGLPTTDSNGVLALDSRSPATLYTGTARHGVYRIELDGSPD